MKKSVVSILSLVVGVLLTVALAYYIGLEKIVGLFSHIKLIFLIFFLITSFFIMFLRVIKWKFVLESHGIEIPFWNLFMYRIAGMAVSYLTPSAHVGGEPVRAYLVSKHGVDFNEAISSVIIDKAIELTLDGLFTVIFITIIVFTFHFSIFLKLFLLFNVLLITFLISLFYIRTINGKGFFVYFYEKLKLNKIKALRKYHENLVKLDSKTMELFYKTKHYFKLAFAVHLLAWLLSVVEYQLILLMFGFKVSWITAFIVYAGVGFAYVVPLPGALGILELVQSIVAKITKLPLQTSFGVGFVVRARDGIWTLIGVLYLYFAKVNITSKFLGRKNNRTKKKVSNNNRGKNEKTRD